MELICDLFHEVLCCRVLLLWLVDWLCVNSKTLYDVCHFEELTTRPHTKTSTFRGHEIFNCEAHLYIRTSDK